MTTEVAEFDPVEYEETTREQWREAAGAWRRRGSTLEEWLDEATETILDMAGVGPGPKREKRAGATKGR